MALVGVLIASTPAHAGTRMALVIGEASYRHVAALRTDLDAQGLRDALKVFGTSARGADATLANAKAADLEAVSLDQLQRQVGKAGGLKVIVLDACRDNPFAATMRVCNRFGHSLR